MGTATILGRSYPTAVLPDGKEWMCENLAYPSLGELSGGGAAFGRLYSWSDCDTLRTLLTDGWRIPEYRVATTTTEWQDLFVAAGIAGVEGKLRNPSLAYWAANPNGENLYGFDLRGAGTEGGGLVTVVGRYWYINYPGNPVGEYYATNWRYDRITTGGGYAALSYSKCSLRLVRDYTPPDQINAEAHETTHALALEWTEAADGTPVAYDDGAAYDYIESTITARMTPDELTALETAWQSSTKLYTIYSTGYLLGPLIDMSAGVEVRLMSYQVDQSADSAMTLYDVTIGVHYGPLSAPSAGSLAVVQSRGRPYHSVAPGAASWITEGGTSDVNAYGRASERSCTWYTHSLTTAQAADVVNALRTIRGSSTTWTAGGVATPWGPGESGTATVWIPEWSIHRESNLLWGVQMELVRNG